MLQCVAVCCSVLQCVAVCCSELQCVAYNNCLLVAYNDCLLRLSLSLSHSLSLTHTNTRTHARTRVLSLSLSLSLSFSHTPRFLQATRKDLQMEWVLRASSTARGDWRLMVTAPYTSPTTATTASARWWQCVAVCCSVLQHITV